MINPKVIAILQEANIEESSALLYLLAIYHNLKTDCIPEDIIRKVNLLKIVERVYEENDILWNIPLFEGQVTDAIWDWVEDIVVQFRKANPERAGVKKSLLVRIKAFFAENPEVRKDDIIEAVKLYLSRTASTYVMKSHKFVYDGTGAMKNSTLLQYVEEVRRKKTSTKSNNPNHKVIK